MYGCLVFPLIYLYCFMRERSRAAYLAMSLGVYSFMIDVMKLLYAGPRPFWDSDSIEALKCSSQYGDPSGHSAATVGFAVQLALDYSARHKLGTVDKILWLGFALVYGASVAYSRVFLGVHSYD